MIKFNQQAAAAAALTPGSHAFSQVARARSPPQPVFRACGGGASSRDSVHAASCAGSLTPGDREGAPGSRVVPGEPGKGSLSGRRPAAWVPSSWGWTRRWEPGPGTR